MTAARRPGGDGGGDNRRCLTLSTRTRKSKSEGAGRSLAALARRLDELDLVPGDADAALRFAARFQRLGVAPDELADLAYACRRHGVEPRMVGSLARTMSKLGLGVAEGAKAIVTLVESCLIRRIGARRRRGEFTLAVADMDRHVIHALVAPFDRLSRESQCFRYAIAREAGRRVAALKGSVVTPADYLSQIVVPARDAGMISADELLAWRRLLFDADQPEAQDARVAVFLSGARRARRNRRS
jgi:hypothetical protein